MEYLFICFVTILACALTLFSGFGLGTILMPVLAIFFPMDLAVGLTAIVHFLNNFFKLFLFVRRMDTRIVAQFGIPAVVFAFIGAQVLIVLGRGRPILVYMIGSHECSVTLLKIIMAILIFAFAMLELLPWFQRMEFARKYLGLGGMLSGFFGGLSGHQGAFRSAFLVKCNLDKEKFIATGVVIACMVDVTRLSVYGQHFLQSGIKNNLSLLIAVTSCALIGTLLGNRLIQKVTVPFIQNLISIMMIIIALVMGFGLV